MTQTRSRSVVKLIHTSDVHLGSDYTPTVAEHALTSVVDAAIAENANFLILAGDVFDHNRVPDALVKFLVDELARFTGRTIILPGNHDAYDHDSVYHRRVFASRANSIILLGDQTNGGRLFFDDLELEFWGKPVIDHHRTNRPMLGYPERQGDYWRVAIAHGHVQPEDDRDERSSPIFPEDIRTAPFDYIALGHWDRCVDVSEGEVTAYYSGAPHFGSWIKQPSHVLKITLDPERGVSVEQHHI